MCIFATHTFFDIMSVLTKPCIRTLLILLTISSSFGGFAQPGSPSKAPLRKEGEGPWDQLIIRGATLINGTLAPPMGPVDIVVEKNRIVSVQAVGTPGLVIDSLRRPKLKPGGKELNATGLYLMPGFADTHGHIGGTAQGANAEYVFK